jgi:hypothetical protein
LGNWKKGVLVLVRFQLERLDKSKCTDKMILAFDTYYFENKAKTVCISFENRFRRLFIYIAL